MATPGGVEFDENVFCRIKDDIAECRVLQGDDVTGLGFLGFGFETGFGGYEVGEGVEVTA